MTLNALFQIIDCLSPAELDQVRQYVERRRRVQRWAITPEQEALLDRLLRTSAAAPCAGDEQAGCSG